MPRVTTRRRAGSARCGGLIDRGSDNGRPPNRPPPAMNPLQEERERATSLDDVRIRRVRPLISPALLQDELPADAAVEREVARDRQAIARIVQGEDRRLLVVVGPCSIHDAAVAMEYARRLRALA